MLNAKSRRPAFINSHDLSRKPVPIPDHVEDTALRDHALSAVELTFLGHALEGFAGTLDPVLVVVAFRRQQLHDGIAADGGGAAEGRRSEINRLSDVVLVRLER